MSARVAVIIPAAGRGRRMGGEGKAFLELDGIPILERTLRAFLAQSRVERIVVALDAATAAQPPAWLRTLDPRVHLVEGGAERHDSVRLALAAVPETIDVVVVHDAARPLVPASLIEAVIDAAAAGRSVAAAIRPADTVHEVDDNRRITATPDRSRLWCAQTPQAFPVAVLRDAHERVAGTSLVPTDDAALVARFGTPVYVIEGDRANLKLTVPADVTVARALLAARE